MALQSAEDYLEECGVPYGRLCCFRALQPSLRHKGGNPVSEINGSVIGITLVPKRRIAYYKPTDL